MKKKKYELVEDDFIIHQGRKLYRIKSLGRIDSILGVYKGDLGGYIEKEENLSQEGTCWVYNHSKVYGNASIKNDASIFNGAIVFDNAVIKDDARVLGCAEISGNAVIKGKARIYNRSQVYDNAMVEDVGVGDSSQIYGNAVVKSMYYGPHVTEFDLLNVNVGDNAKIMI